jgi:hypothetical protein
MIDGKLLETETALITGGLESGEARAFLEAMPTAEQLMPAIGLDDLGVVHWQPPEDAAGVLLTPSTTADRRRRRILRAVEANPGASDRKVAEIAGCDHKTVAADRRTAGESPERLGNSPAGAVIRMRPDTRESRAHDKPGHPDGTHDATGKDARRSLTEQLARRREAALKLPPLSSGIRDPELEAGHPPSLRRVQA